MLAIDPSLHTQQLVSEASIVSRLLTVEGPLDTLSVGWGTSDVQRGLLFILAIELPQTVLERLALTELREHPPRRVERAISQLGRKAEIEVPRHGHDFR